MCAALFAFGGDWSRATGYSPYSSRCQPVQET